MSTDILWREAAAAFDSAALQLHRAATKLEKLHHDAEAMRVRNMLYDCRNMRNACADSAGGVTPAPQQEKRAISNPSA